jgi:hypothetical protein
MLRYCIALIVAIAIILVGFAFARLTYGEIETIFEQHHQRLKQQKADGTLPEEWKDVDLDAIKYTEFGMQLTRGMQIRLDLTMWLVELWFVLIPLVMATCLGAAFVWGRIFRRRG